MPILWRRIQALVFEGILVSLGSLGLMLAFLASQELLGLLRNINPEFWYPYIFLGDVVLLCMGLAFFEFKKGRSIGHSLVYLEIDNELSFIQLSLRHILKYVPFFAMATGVLLSGFDLTRLFTDLWYTWVFNLFSLFAILSTLSFLTGKKALHNRIFGVTVIADVSEEQRPSYLVLRITALVLFLGIAVLIALPNFVTPQDQSCGGDGGSTLKANMFTLQTMLETYAVDWGGIYPVGLEALKKDANLNKGKEYGAYWKEFNNPVTRYKGLGKAFADEGSMVPIEGLVTYKVNADLTFYHIYAYATNAKPLMAKGSQFMLSNS